MSVDNLLPVAPVMAGMDRGFVMVAGPLEWDPMVSPTEAGEGLDAPPILSRTDVSTSEEREAFDPVAGGESLTADESFWGLIQEAREPVGGLGGGDESWVDFVFDVRFNSC